MRAREKIAQAMKDLGADELIVACPQCQETIRAHFPETRVTSVWEALAESWDPMRRYDELQLAVHDPCRSRHDPEVHAAIRTLVRTCGAEVVETDYSHERTRCCGSGGKIDNVDPELFSRIAARASSESELPMVTYCMGCRSALREAGRETIHVLDLLMVPNPVDHALEPEIGIFMRLVNRLRSKWAIRRMVPVAPD